MVNGAVESVDNRDGGAVDHHDTGVCGLDACPAYRGDASYLPQPDLIVLIEQGRAGTYEGHFALRHHWNAIVGQKLVERNQGKMK